MSLLQRFTGALGLLFRGSVENPSVPLSQADDWWFDKYSGGATASGVHVNRAKALENSAWFRGINLLSSSIAKLPCDIFERSGEGKEKARSHPAYRLLRKKPNASTTAFIFWQTRIAQALDTGNSYALILRKQSGAPIELVNTDPDKTYPVRVGGKLMYAIEAGGKMSYVEPEDMLHVRGFGFDGLVGYSVRLAAREELGLGASYREHSSRFFKNGAGQRVLLEHPEHMTKEAQDRFLAGWGQMTAGVDNSHKTAILEEGMKAKTIGVTARESQLTEGVALNIRQIANFLGIPPHKLGDVTSKTYASLEQENQSFLNDSVDAWLVNIEQESEDKLLTEDQKREDSHLITFNRNALVRADFKSRNEGYKSATAGVPWLTVNEIRAMENKNPLPGFDQLIVPINLLNPAEPAASEPDPDPTSEESGVEDNGADGRARAASEAVLADARTRMIRRLVTRCRKASKTPKTFGDWMATVREDEGPVVRSALRPGVAVYAALTGVDVAEELDTRFADVFSAVLDPASHVYTNARSSEFEASMSAMMQEVEPKL